MGGKTLLLTMDVKKGEGKETPPGKPFGRQLVSRKPLTKRQQCTPLRKPHKKKQSKDEPLFPQTGDEPATAGKAQIWGRMERSHQIQNSRGLIKGGHRKNANALRRPQIRKKEPRKFKKKMSTIIAALGKEMRALRV